ncbi:MAG: histidine kinase [Hungatella hathewayi]|nr:histidine kinase [Hungatella hathewayi]
MKHPTRLFLKNFITHLLTIAIPVLVLGTLAFNLTYYYIYDSAADASLKSLEQARQSVSQVTAASDAIEKTFNPDAFSGISLKQILKMEHHTYGAAVRLPVFSSILNSLVNTNDSIDSAYIYWPGDYDKLLVSNRGISYLYRMKDTGWIPEYEAYAADLSRPLDVSSRVMRDEQGAERPVITLYQKIITLDYQSSGGMAVINVRQDVIQNSLKNQRMSPGQQIYLFNDSGSFLTGTDMLDEKHGAMLRELVLSPEGGETSEAGSIHKSQDGYTISVMRDADAPFLYVSMIPNRQLYAVPRNLFVITAVLVCISLFLSLTLAAMYSRKTSRDIHAIMDIFDAAQNGRPLPAAGSSSGDEYSYILTNLISTFVRQEYLSVQLSEKLYRARTLELTALQSQINPHFLFNTLETIHLKAFTLTEGANDVTYLIENLSGILRYALSNPNERVSFADELDYTKAYLNIQKFRYKNKFHVIWEYDEEVLPVRVIKLLMQPLIENAIYHGIKEAPGECLLKIKVYIKKETIYLHIIDTGIGMTPERLLELRESIHREDSSYEHIGLTNTFKRLTLTYGEHVFIRIRSRYGRGTSITLAFPAQPQEL